jgi:hypothetical protein
VQIPCTQEGNPEKKVLQGENLKGIFCTEINQNSPTLQGVKIYLLFFLHLHSDAIYYEKEYHENHDPFFTQYLCKKHKIGCLAKKTRSMMLVLFLFFVVLTL